MRFNDTTPFTGGRRTAWPVPATRQIAASTALPAGSKTTAPYGILAVVINDSCNAGSIRDDDHHETEHQ